MSALEPLCDYCIKVELNPDAHNTLFTSWSLGPGLRIKNSRCPLCKLVKHAYYEDQSTRPSATMLSEERIVMLTWLGASGPGNRGAFTFGAHFTSYIWICFAGELDTDSLVADAYYLQLKLQSELEVSRVSRWLSMCTSTHSVDCNFESSTTFKHAFPGLRVLRLIDVVQNRLVETQSICQYVALSYVWGAVPNFKLTKANRRELLAPGGIEMVWGMLPRTIRDAVELVRRLGHRYLWVDTLCLLQNDPEDLELGVAVMDQVYERSWLAIIAACGYDANAGLPGVRDGSRKVSNLTRQVKDGVSLGVYTGLDRLLKHSVYNSRAWTFQEHLLPRRALYFVDNKVFFRCRKAEYAESCFDHPRPTEPDISFLSLIPPPIYMRDPLNDFSTMLFHYTQRVLTNQDDVVRAMAGIIRRFSDRVKYRFFEGLPSAALDAFIIFQSHRAILHRRKGFPSYSWVGWRGGIIYQLEENSNDWLRMQTWIIWYKRSPSGITNLVWDPFANPSFPIHDLEYVGYRERGTLQLPPALRITTSRKTPTEALAFNIPRLTYPLLQFWTLAVFYKIGSINVFAAYGAILDESGTICGNISLDGFEETIFFDSGGLFEFLLLSAQDSTTYNVMLLEWNEGIAERRGIGTIKQLAIEMSFPPGPVWKEILLA